MSYSEENGQVVLRMSREDFALLIRVASYSAHRRNVKEMLIRVNTPYRAEGNKTSQAQKA